MIDIIRSTFGNILFFVLFENEFSHANDAKLSFYKVKKKKNKTLVSEKFDWKKEKHSIVMNRNNGK